ncbi:MAG: hypothetical protein H7Z14_16180 [Anaerolineae bacterium]|nr:hypothetical protein [Phycisphaerae bacterium]
MNIWLQHFLVAVVALACAAFIARQAFKTLTLRRSKLGACCSKGCDVGEKAATTTQLPTTERVQFLPVEMLSRKR